MSVGDARALGLSRDRAQLFGMPHIGCEYASMETGAYAGLPGERCVLCGRPAASCHHVVPLSVAETVVVAGHVLRSPLWGLCGSGTTGCHSLLHGGARYSVRWEWDEPWMEGAWWSGETLSRVPPHSDELFSMGRYVVTDRIMDADVHIGVF